MATAWANACIKLLQGIVYDDDLVWKELLQYQREVTAFFEQIGVKVFVERDDGFAYLEQESENDESETVRLIRRYQLSFELSLLCVLLRDELEKFDTSQNDSAILILSETEIRSLLSVYFKEKTDQTKLYRELGKYLNQAVELSFLKELPQDNLNAQSERKFEVRRILRKKIDADFLVEFKNRLDGVKDAT